jgi:hypothetical protein
MNDYMEKEIHRFRGPNLILLAAAHIVVFGAGLIAGAVLRHGAFFVTPFAPAEELRLFFAQNPTAVRVSSFFLFGSAIPLGIFAVTAVSRLNFLGVRAAGTNITLFGGIGASMALILSGMSGWILSVPEVFASAPVVKAIDFLNFLSGGVFFAVGFGLLAAGVSVTSHFQRLLPRWLVVLGMLLAVTGELSWVSLIAYPANFFIPITRFAGFVWMIMAAVALTKRGKGISGSSTA